MKIVLVVVVIVALISFCLICFMSIRPVWISQDGARTSYYTPGSKSIAVVDPKKARGLGGDLITLLCIAIIIYCFK